jgi:sugar/nucleoside kinase (ribokinase family)
MEILVVGTVAFDAIETPFGKIDKIEGGAANYISLSASFFENKINLVSVIGDDFPKDYLDILENRGINLEGLQVIKGKDSFFWSGKYHLDMNTRDTLATELNVLSDFTPIIPKSYQNSEVIMLGNLTPQVQQQVLAQLKKKPKLVVLDTMNFWMETEMDNLLEVLKYVDVLTINDEEARLLSNEYSLIKASKKIFKLGPKYLVIKKGEHGALLFHENKVFFAPALPLEDVFDPTGAGDTFAGGFVGHLTQSGNFSFNNMKNAVIYGSALASFTVEKFGPSRLLEITKGEIDNRVQEFIDLIQFDFSLINGQ